MAEPRFDFWRMTPLCCVQRAVLGLTVGFALLCRQLTPAQALENPGEVLDKEVGVFTELGKSVDLSLPFTDYSGTMRPLRGFVVPEKPIIIVPVYYKCPRLCGLIQEGVLELLKSLDLKVGIDFSLLMISFDPREGVAEARASFDTFNNRLKSAEEGLEGGYTTLVGDEASITQVMQQLGFKYKQEGADFAHSAAVMVLTPTGQISQYFTGIQFNPWDVHLSLVEASMGKIGTAIDHLLLYCFRFDSLQGRYVWAVEALLRIGGALTLLVLGGVYLLMRYRGFGKYPRGNDADAAGQA
jgi:protein SCO1/2